MQSPSYYEPDGKKGRKNWSALTAGVLALILIVVIILFVLPNFFSIGNFLTTISNNGNGATSTFFVNQGSPNGTGLLGSSTNVNSSGKIEIAYPTDYSLLANYSLSIINENRSSAGLAPVTFSPIPSGQQHADSMLNYAYFSHWDTQGLKPYMRYSILNGTGFVEENVAYEYTSLPSYTNAQSVERAINSLEWQMMNNDSLCCSNGHRDNILNPFHNRVSIGIAYDSTHVYFVEDFETYLANLSTPIDRNGNIQLAGNTFEGLSPTSVLVFYDPTPTSLTTTQLETTYYGPYGQGDFVGGIVPPCSSIFGRCLEFSQGITSSAAVWQITSNSINIQFSLADFIQRTGNGVYTIYLVQGNQDNPEYLTSISVFVSS